MSDYGDIVYSEQNGVATVTINRPDALNALRVATYEEIADALLRAGWNRTVGVVVLAGAGPRAFCVGADTSQPKSERQGRGILGVALERIHGAIRDIPKPVIAKVRGYALGGGNTLAALCDFTIASDTAQFGELGARVGSVDAGFGTAYLARIVGEKRAREIVYMCRRYSAAEALAMGLVNAVVPDAELDAETARWCDELLQRSPTALAIAKASFNADTDAIGSIRQLGYNAVALYFGSDEAREAAAAAREKRRPNFRGDAR
ncbi:MAG: enoyl-CoA hydratase/isomerase family protein [Pseudorhodoplanes sp.]|nr:1,4-dihydroxy-2-naphthoyl-CoA synthase [Pseudorhodoplanes sp.]MBW7949548.1 enoyl-CoA hydratase/isomerase family protein [Pseudorhodoplanes sp.]MCL4711665.1 enoyl-CoA hydratase/isomerase family protein [Pseudorhodoplanes sp.]MCQ3942420.1 1,4-dihydroxy-2-naphthoyl-CoA synthase [Alphaproteobacteria bacterium]GIK81406.1 MAG: 1,4-dihydroxy-2-naphthoyl-CoA synthase [Alphaproteobacteria bacterium]